MEETVAGQPAWRFSLGVSVIGAMALLGYRIAIEMGFPPDGMVITLGVPLEYFILAWFLGTIALALDSLRLPESDAKRCTLYAWWASIGGMGVCWWVIKAYGGSRFITYASPVYVSGAVAIASVFVIMSMVHRKSTGQRARIVGIDMIRIGSRATTWGCAFAGIGAMALGPRSWAEPIQPAVFKRWFDRQPVVSLPSEFQPYPVTLVEFVDYQCPVCRDAERLYREVLARVKEAHGRMFGMVRVDFPLENECNAPDGISAPGGLHLASCEAAVAVQLARSRGAEAEEAMITCGLDPLSWTV